MKSFNLNCTIYLPVETLKTVEQYGYLNMYVDFFLMEKVVISFKVISQIIKSNSLLRRPLKRHILYR